MRKDHSLCNGAGTESSHQRWKRSVQHFSWAGKGFAPRALTLAFILAGALLVLPWQLVTSTTYAAYAASGDWPTYLASNRHHGSNTAETIINPSSASHLKLHWTYTGGGSIFSQPVVAHNMIYWGSLDGYEHASNLSGGQVWQQYLGQTTSHCGSHNSFGVVSTATVASVAIHGSMTSVVFVGGGDASFYALNASSGQIVWKTALGSPSSNRFIWSSPALYNGSAYIGMASLDNCPSVQGQVIQMDVSTGAIQHTFNVVPDGCIGGGVWGSPTVDQGDGTLYFATGSADSCSTKEVYAYALVKLRASDLTFISSWQVPRSERTRDSDFGSTPTLFHVTNNGSTQHMVGVANKNGIYYAFDRTHLSRGPLWQAVIAIGGQCPECGDGSISPSGWDGTTLYVAGGKTTINGSNCPGSLRALDPATGAFIWQHCMQHGAVISAVSLVPGVAAVIEGAYLVLIATSSGNTLFTSFGSNSQSHFYGSASISDGVLYVGNMDKQLYAFGT